MSGNYKTAQNVSSVFGACSRTIHTFLSSPGPDVITIKSGSEVIKLFMLNSAEHEILNC